MSTFVLVHGAWHGGWCWRRLEPLLRAKGHAVFTPSLTGLGDRAHLARPDINLDLHVQDVVTLLEMEDLNDIVLVGHSYGGMVVTGVADRVPQRVRELVYLDAFVPENGKCCLDYVVPERAAAMRTAGKGSGMVPPPPLSLWGHTNPADVEWMRPREVMHPFRTMAQPIRLANEAALARIPKSFIYCSSPATGSFDQFATRYRKAAGWRYFELETGHDAMILKPQQLADLFLKLTGGTKQ
jgi:pimeloyl-ACP methyl ester carboxylesterase